MGALALVLRKKNSVSNKKKFKTLAAAEWRMGDRLGRKVREALQYASNEYRRDKGSDRMGVTTEVQVGTGGYVHKGEV
jgi:hypothetical protein